MLEQETPMIPFNSRRKTGILGTVSLNIQRSTELSLKKEFLKNRSRTQLEQVAGEKEDNISSSSRSSQSEISDVVRLNSNNNKSVCGSWRLPNTVLESKPTIALFIGDLHESVTEKVLSCHFSKFKSLLSTKVCFDSSNGKSLGYGYLNFSSKEDADMATEEFNYRPINGKEVRIMPSLRNAFFRKNIGTNVFFSCLPLENPVLTTRVFYDTFKTYGKILSCKLDNRKNIGFVYFESDRAARNAINDYNNTYFYGTKISCGVHFDKSLRKYPDFEKRKSSLESITISKEQLVIPDGENTHDSHNELNQVPHPNAIFVTNLAPNCTNDDILDFFCRIGPIKSVFSSKVNKYNSLWAFVTYKKGKDTEIAIKLYNGKIFKNRELKVVKAIPKESRNFYHANYKTTVYFENASFVCNEEFLTQFCIQERIQFIKIQITSYDEIAMTYSGFVRCCNEKGAERLFGLLDRRLIGGSVIKCVSKNAPHIRLSQHISSEKPAKNTPYSPYYNQNHFPQQKIKSQEGLPMLLLSYGQPFVYNNCSLKSTPIGNINNKKTNEFISEDEKKQKQVLDYLKRQVRRGIEFLKCPIASKSENLESITEYIFEVYWKRNIGTLTNFLFFLRNNSHNESILHMQIEEAANFLGFGI